MFTEHIKGNLRAMAKKLSPTLVKLTKLGQVTSIHHTVSTCLPFKFTGIPKPTTTDFKISDSIISTFTPKMHLKFDERDKK